MECTQAEIQSKINQLQDEVDFKSKERSSLSKRINELKKQVEYWRELDESQLKAF